MGVKTRWSVCESPIRQATPAEQTTPIKNPPKIAYAELSPCACNLVACSQISSKILEGVGRISGWNSKNRPAASQTKRIDPAAATAEKCGLIAFMSQPLLVLIRLSMLLPGGKNPGQLRFRQHYRIVETRKPQKNLGAKPARGIPLCRPLPNR